MTMAGDTGLRGLSPTQTLAVHYRAVEAGFVVRENYAYRPLVVANGNDGEPVHGWFRLKEAFSAALLPHILRELDLVGRPSLRILDPFAGSATTAVAAGELAAIGTLRDPYVLSYECNPFLHLVGQTKLRALQRPNRQFLPLAKRVAAKAARGRVEPAAVPDLVAFSNADYFDPPALDRLLRLRAALDIAASEGADALAVDLARVCLGASIEPASALRRDGRALRYVAGKQTREPIAEFLRRAERIDEDMGDAPNPIRGRVQLGDGRALTPRAPRPGSIDLVLFSPPYPNNIDYTEVYKLEAWLLGLIADHDEFRSQRLRTVYSHPSVLRSRATGIELEDAATITKLLDPLLGAVPDDRYAGSRTAMLQGYATDMLRTLRACKRALKPGGYLVYVVGNSAHGAGGSHLVVAADLLIAQLAVHVGLEVLSVEVARYPRRRKVDSPFLRESVVFARCPGAP